MFFSVTDFVQKLVNKGKQLDAVKFVIEFNLSNKFPPASLLKAHLEAAKKAAQELCDRGDNSIQSLNEAIAKELDALRDVIKNIEISKLEAQYPPKPLKIRVAELEQSKLNVKRAVSTMIESSTKLPQQEKQQKRRRRAMKRPHLFNAITVVAPSASAHSRSSYQAASVEMDQTRYTENKRLSDEDQELLRLEPPVAAAPLKSRRAVCYTCREPGHSYCACLMKIKSEAPVAAAAPRRHPLLGKKMCYVCRKPGHLSHGCPMKMTSCYNCGQMGHRRTECPMLQ